MESKEKIKERKRGRPPVDPTKKRSHLHSIYLSDKEETLLKKMMEETGKDAADLFRHSLFGKGLKIPRPRLVPPELMETLTDFKKKSSLLQYFSNKERDFSPTDRDLLIGSSNSLRMAIERFQRSVFLSLDKSDHLEYLEESLAQITSLTRKLKEQEKPLKSNINELENWLLKARKILEHQYRYLSMKW